MNWELFFDIHKDLPREGAGRDEYTQKAFEMIPKIKNPKILDIGCGPGLQTIKLARLTDGEIIGIDNHQPFLEQLKENAKKHNLTHRIKAINKSMFDMDFQKEYFDIIWAEGSIFIIGFETGLKEWKKFVKSDGYIAIHEMTWLKKDPPKEIYDYWQEVYPAISTIDDNLKIIEKCGYKILGHFPLPDDAWWEFYYDPLQIRLKDLKVKYKDNSEALELIAETDKEIDLFKKYNQWYGSVFYVMQKQS